jgi:ankyrin repeat protein
MDLFPISPDSEIKTNPFILFDSLLNNSYDIFVQQLFENSSLLDLTNPYGETLLHYASFFGMIDKYYALINMGASVQKTQHNNNLLHYTSYSGKDNFLIVELIKSGISPIETNIYNQTSLHMCADEKIAFYFNLWCMRNKIKVTDLIDKQGNNVAHGCQSAGHNQSASFWVKNYPALATQVNHIGQTWLDVKQTDYNYQFCKFKPSI